MVQPSSAACGEGTAVGPGEERRGLRSLLQQLWRVGVRLCCGLQCPSVCLHSLHRAGQRTASRGVMPRGGCCPHSVRLPLASQAHLAQRDVHTQDIVSPPC